jgi:hypothetical protein
MTTRIAPAITAAALMLLLAGCGGSPTPAPTPTFGFGDAAVDIARAVPACRAASSQAVPADVAGVTSIATCSINGSQVDFFVWKDAAAQVAGGLTTGTTEAYVAHGDGWDAVTHESGRLSMQKLIASNIVGAAGGTIVHVG